jgi:hypothetical protein
MKEERSSGCVTSEEDLQFGHPSFLLELWSPFEPFLRWSYCSERALIPWLLVGSLSSSIHSSLCFLTCSAIFILG